MQSMQCDQKCSYNAKYEGGGLETEPANRSQTTHSRAHGNNRTFMKIICQDQETAMWTMCMVTYTLMHNSMKRIVASGEGGQQIVLKTPGLTHLPSLLIS